MYVDLNNAPIQRQFLVITKDAILVSKNTIVSILTEFCIYIWKKTNQGMGICRQISVFLSFVISLLF
jgi:hypothetical protein